MSQIPDSLSVVSQDDLFTSSVLLLINRERDRELLQQDFVDDLDVLVGSQHLHDERIGLVVVDPGNLGVHWKELLEMRDDADEVFLPVLLLVEDREAVGSSLRLWQVVDEMIQIPVRRRQFRLRVRMLLRARRYSQISARRNRRLTEEMEALERQKEEFRALFTASRDPIVLTAPDGRILKANPAAHRLFIWDDESLTERSFQMHFDRENLLGELYSTVEKQGSVHDIEVTLVRSDGTNFIGNISASIHRERDGRACQFIIRDISESKAYEQQLIEAREKAEEMNRLKSAFLANMSHEIRTPLASIIGYADLLAEEIPGQFKQFVKVVRDSGERLLATLESVLSLAQLESGSMEVVAEEVNVGDLLDEVVEPFHAEAEHKGLYFHVETPEAPIVGEVDRSIFARIVSHLVHNAVKFTHDGGVTVEVRESEDATACLLVVSDTGIGIEEEITPVLFEAFRQASTGRTRRYEGSGLGLTLTKELVDLVGGSIDIQSAENSGTTFTVRVPWSSGSETNDVRSLQGAHKWGLDALPSQQQVLIVDDDPAVRELLVEMLPEAFVVDTASQADEALSLALSHRYDLILLDINLRDTINGVEVHERLRETEGVQDALIVAITAYAQAGDGEHFHASGFDGYVPKPFTQQTLYENLIQVMA